MFSFGCPHAGHGLAHVFLLSLRKPSAIVARGPTVLALGSPRTARC